MGDLCRVELFGGLRVFAGGVPCHHFRTRKTGHLLAYLAFHIGKIHPREHLSELFWPECDLEPGRHSLNVALSSLRHQLVTADPDRSVVQADRHAVWLDGSSVTTDVADFEAALSASSRDGTDHAGIEWLRRAVDLYAGDLLPGYYDEWIFPEQQRLQELFHQSLRRLSVALEATGDLIGAVQLAERAAQHDPLNEGAHREVIRLHAAAGQPAAARRWYDLLTERLSRDLHSEPAEETAALVRSLADSRRPAAVAQGSGVPPCVLPVPSADPQQPPVPLEPVGGAMPLHSRFYIVRSVDRLFEDAVTRRDSIVLVGGPRQVGKTSLLARGLQVAREQGLRVALSSLQAVNTFQLESPDRLFMALATMLCDELDLSTPPSAVWSETRGPSQNLRRYLRRVVFAELDRPLVWALDEVDRLFECAFASDVFGLFRSWHDERALDPEGPFASLTLAIAYSTEARLFITDMSQSPFNVGTRINPEDFSAEQVDGLNRRYGRPLPDVDSVTRFMALVGGHPYLVRRGLHELAESVRAGRGFDLDAFERMAVADHWVFGDHLQRLLLLLHRDEALGATLAQVFAGSGCVPEQPFYRLRSAGILAGDDPASARVRCGLYAEYLGKRLFGGRAAGTA